MNKQWIQSDIIQSSAYGEISIDPTQIYSFDRGLIGFPNEKKYALLPMKQSNVFILHAFHEDVSFIIMPAEKIDREYSFQIDKETVELLAVDKPEEVVVFLIVHIAENQLFINAKAPLLLVPSTQKGCQFVIHDSAYAVREPLRLKDESLC